MISNEGPTEDSIGSWSQTQRIKYVANLDDNGEILQCLVKQEDDQGDVNTYSSDEQARIFLSVKKVLEPPRALSMGIVGAIVGVIIAIILAFLFLAFAWHTRRWCFATPITILGPDNEKSMHIGTLNEKERLLGNSIDIQTDDDPIKKITKYQTHLIMLGDKLMETPESEKYTRQTNSLAKETAKLLKNMADNENDEHIKNRFLLAAKGLTDTVGVLLSESKCAAEPGDDHVRYAADTALQQVKNQSAESVILVRTILLLRQLEEAARDAVEAAKASIKVTKDASNANDDLSEDIVALDVVSKVLDEKIENFSSKGRLKKTRPKSSDAIDD